MKIDNQRLKEASHYDICANFCCTGERFFFFCFRQIFHLVFISSVRYKVIIIVMNVLGYIYVLDPFRR